MFHMIYSFCTDIIVVCPKCSKAGIICFNKERNIILFQCEYCYIEKEITLNETHTFEVTAQCTLNRKYFRTLVHDEKIYRKKVRIKCPYYNESVIGDVSNIIKSQCIVFQSIQYRRKPYFHYPLYF